ncbi:flagellar biosynthetic protein FliR [Candidatus Liberibacter brunswickensis]|uniref:flagellar biosynthetic protein FliR n=1 Tax=Candidatus Liberibacter brunswickensis TaxID=1968796 RepID=UPI002FE34E51
MYLFLIICRIGGCIMFLPGISMVYIPMQVRFYFAVAFSIILLPFIWDIIDIQKFEDRSYYLKLVMVELFVGCTYGLCMHIYTLGLQFVGSVISTTIGLNLQPSMGISDSNLETPFNSLIGTICLLALFIMDFHHHIFYAIVQSYLTVSIGEGFDINDIFPSFVSIFQTTFIIMLRLSSPFLFFFIVFNISIGLLNKLVPQIPVYFISTPYMIGVGSLFLYLLIDDIIYHFSHSFLYGFIQ